MSSRANRFPHYSKLLRLYPISYRREYGGQMLQTLADMLDDPAQSHTAVWMRMSVDFPRSVLRQQLIYIGGTMQTTPGYITTSARFGMGLIAPFFILVLLNSLLHERLRNSFVWHPNVLLIWLVLLPIVAVIVSVVAFTRYVHHLRADAKTSTWKALRDVRHTWPVLGVAVLGLVIVAFVFGHDSIGCVNGNPIRELHNPRQTLQCIQRGND